MSLIGIEWSECPPGKQGIVMASPKNDLAVLMFDPFHRDDGSCWQLDGFSNAPWSVRMPPQAASQVIAKALRVVPEPNPLSPFHAMVDIIWRDDKRASDWPSRVAALIQIAVVAKRVAIWKPEEPAVPWWFDRYLFPSVDVFEVMGL